jgi:cysteinyl-tRNA synthetase, unknown class
MLKIMPNWLIGATLLLILLAETSADENKGSRKPRKDYRAEMRSFVLAISAQAKKDNAAFLVVPQGGAGLLTENGEPDGKPVDKYLKAIDGIGQEDIFYGFGNENKKTPKKETDAFLKQLAVATKAGKTVLSIDYTGDRDAIDDARRRNADAGFISFVADHRGLDNIPKYPAKPGNQNRADIKTLKDVKNFLYLIDGISFASKEKYLAALAATNFDLIILDPITGDWKASADDLKPLKTKPVGGRRLVLCYVSIGEAENYRFYWKKGWKPGNPNFLGPENPEWKRNFAARYWDADWQAVILGGKDSYLSRVLSAGFDGIYLDKVDEYEWFEEHGE